MPEEYRPIGKRIKRFLGVGGYGRDVNLPIEGATAAAQQRANQQQAAETIDTLKKAGKAINRFRSESAQYDFRKRNNLRRGGQ